MFTKRFTTVHKKKTTLLKKNNTVVKYPDYLALFFSKNIYFSFIFVWKWYLVAETRNILCKKNQKHERKQQVNMQNLKNHQNHSSVVLKKQHCCRRTLHIRNQTKIADYLLSWRSMSFFLVLFYSWKWC